MLTPGGHWRTGPSTEGTPTEGHKARASPRPWRRWPQTQSCASGALPSQPSKPQPHSLQQCVGTRRAISGHGSQALAKPNWRTTAGEHTTQEAWHRCWVTPGAHPQRCPQVAAQLDHLGCPAVASSTAHSCHALNLQPESGYAPRRVGEFHHSKRKRSNHAATCASE